MTIDDERDMLENFWYITNGCPVEPEYDTNRIITFLEEHRKIKNCYAHAELQQDIVEHH